MFLVGTQFVIFLTLESNQATIAVVVPLISPVTINSVVPITRTITTRTTFWITLRTLVFVVRIVCCHPGSLGGMSPWIALLSGPPDMRPDPADALGTAFP